jgi:hypothetical protein
MAASAHQTTTLTGSAGQPVRYADRAIELISAQEH